MSGVCVVVEGKNEDSRAYRREDDRPNCKQRGMHQARTNTQQNVGKTSIFGTFKNIREISGPFVAIFCPFELMKIFIWPILPGKMEKQP